MKRILKIGFLILCLEVLSKGIGYLFNIVLVKSISVVDYGLFTFSWGMVMSLVSISSLGINNALCRFIAFRRGQSKDFKDIISTGWVFTLLSAVVWSAGFVGVCILYPTLFSLDTPSILLVVFLFMLQSISLFSGSVLQGLEKPHINSLLSTLGQLLKFVFVFIVILLFPKSMYLLFLAVVLAFVLPTLISLKMVWKTITPAFTWARLKEMLVYSVPTTITKVSWTVFGWADIFVVRLLLGFQAVGVFYVATIIANVLVPIVGSFMSIFEPVTARLFGEKKMKEISAQNRKLLLGFFTIYLIIGVVICVLSHLILLTFFSKDYATFDGVWTLRVLVFSTIFFSLSKINLRTIEASGKPMLVAKITAVAAVINVVLDYFIMVPRYWMVGAAITDLLVGIIIFAASYRQSQNLVAAPAPTPECVLNTGDDN